MKTFTQAITTSFVGVFLGVFLCGCAAGPQAVDTATSDKAYNNGVTVRAIYDAAKGNYDNVSDADKKKLIEIYKDEAGAKKAFDLIKNPPGGVPGAPPQAGNQ